MKASHRYLFGLTTARIAVFLGLSASAAVLEGFGMAMFLPVLQFVEKGRDLAALSAQSEMWGRLIHIFHWLNLDITLTALLSAAIGMMLLRTAAMYCRQVYTSWLGQTVLHTTRSNLFGAYMAMDYDAFGSLSSGEVINLLTTETQRAATSFTALFQLFSNTVVVAGFVCVLLWLSAPLTGLAVAYLCIAAALVAFYVRHTRTYSYKASGANAAFSRKALDRLGGFRLVKLTATGSREADVVRRASDHVRALLFWLARVNASVDLIMEVLALLAGGGILYMAVAVFGLGLSQVGLFVLILLRLLPLAKEVLRSRQSYMATVGSRAAVIGGHECVTARREPSGGGRPFTRLRQGIRLEGVTFRYDEASDAALHDITLDIPAGCATALVGRSGAGKTTLADLVPRLRIPQQGRMLYDGVDGAGFDLASLRRSMAYVSQDAAMLDDTVAANLRFANPGASDDELWAALERAQAAEFVRDLPLGLDSRLGERGILLSGGQKQRLSLARAFLQDTGVLILDEPTSALDSETEQGIQRVLKELRAAGEVTVVIIAHRLSTIRSADRIVVLEGGRLVEQGSHDELLAAGGWYARITSMQGATTDDSDGGMA